MRWNFFSMMMAAGLAALAGNSWAQQHDTSGSDSVRSTSPIDTTSSRLADAPAVFATADWPQYENNPFTFSVPEPVSKDQFFVVEVNGDGLMDFTYRSETKLYVFDHYGDLLWSANIDNPRADITAGSHDGTGHGAADVDGDGVVEIVALNRSNEMVIYDGATGAVERTVSLPIIGANNKWVYIAVANLRGNGDRDVILQTMDTSGAKKGLYINKNLLARDLENDRELWRVQQDDDHSNGIYEGYWGVGHGSFQCADVDGDGRDEVVGGNMVDDDGRVVDLGYPTDWVNAKSDGSTDHLDALSIGDFRPDLPGLEWLVVEEENSGTANFNTTLLSTSGIIWRKMTTSFTGAGREPQNVAAGNFDPNKQYCEVWNRSRFSGPSNSQHPWVFDAFGTQFADYATEAVLPSGFSTHPYGNKEGLEEISTIDWDGGSRNYLAAKARHVNGNIGVFNALTGDAVWYTPLDFPATYASIIYVADISGDSREEVIINDTTGTIRVYWNAAVNPNPPTARKWTNPLYRRTKQNWNYYSPGGYIDASQTVLPSITLILPNGGEQWIAGSTQTITWSSSGGISNVILQFSTDGGEKWSTIAGTVDDGSYAWTVAETVSSQCLIRVMSATGGSPSDVSDGFFAIVEPPPPTLTMIAPNGGESWAAGSTQTIRWSSTGALASVGLEFSASSGAVWTLITASTNNDGAYQWTVPDSISSSCLVRVFDAVDSDPIDESAGFFAIVAPPPAPVIDSFAPTSGTVGAEVTITGEHFTGATSVQFNGASASTFTVDSATQIRVDVPAGATSGQISVTTSGGTAFSASDFTVTIPPPAIDFFSPTSGAVGAEVTITGSNFVGAETVQFNGASASTFTIDSATQIRAKVPVGATSGLISVTTAGGTTSSATDFAVTAGTPSTLSFTPGHDAYVKSSSANSNYGSATTLRARKSSSETLNAYLKFEVSGITGAVQSAKLRLYVTDASSDGGEVYLVSNDLQGTTTAWRENTLKWNNAPAINGSALSAAGAVSVGNWVELDVSAAITGNGIFSFALKSNVSDVVYYTSKEGADKPELVVQVGGGSPPVPTITSFNPGSGPAGTEVTISGAQFSGATSVKFNGTFAAAYTVDSDTQIRATVPVGATTGKISVMVAGGTAVSANDFTVTTAGGSTTVIFNPSRDAYVKSSAPTTNYGSSATLRLRKTSSETINSYLKFEVEGLADAVQSAKLRLYVTEAGVDGGAVYAVSNDYQGTSTEWTQSGLNWNNAPAISGAALSSVGSVSAGGWVEFEVTAAITGNGAYSFGLMNDAFDVVYYSSKEGANMPELVIQTGAGSFAAREPASPETDAIELSEEFSVSPSCPNPFNGQTRIEYLLAQQANVRLVIYNILGQAVCTLVDAAQTAGRKTVTWDGRDERGQGVGSGVYFYRFKIGVKTFTGKMILQQ